MSATDTSRAFTPYYDSTSLGKRVYFDDIFKLSDRDLEALTSEVESAHSMLIANVNNAKILRTTEHRVDNVTFGRMEYKRKIVGQIRQTLTRESKERRLKRNKDQSDQLARKFVTIAKEVLDQKTFYKIMTAATMSMDS